MNKVMSFLEKYVQWLALGVGLVWIGLMAYMFWAGPNASIQLPGVAGKTYGPGELDDEMLHGSGPVKSLSEAIDKNAPSIVPKKAVTPSSKPSFVKEYQLALAGTAATAADFIDPIIPGNKGASNMAFETGKTNTAVVKAHIPELNGEVLLEPLTGKDAAGLAINAVTAQSVVQIPDPSTLPKDPLNADGAGAAAGAPGDNLGGVAAPVAPAVPAVAAVPPAPTEVELSWATISYKLNMLVLRQAFNEAKVPIGAPTSFLAVKVIRQTLDGNNWQNEVEVPPLANRAVPPLPADNDVNGSRLFLVWAQKNQADLVHPPFYVVSRGAPWRTVTMPPPASDPNAAPVAVVADQAFDPANPPKDRPLTAVEQGKVYEYGVKKRREEAKAKAEAYKAAHPPATPRPAPGGTGGGGGAPLRGYSPIPRDYELVSVASADRMPILLADATPVTGQRPGERPIVRRPGAPIPTTPTPTTPGTTPPLGTVPFGADAAGGQPGIVEGSFDPATAQDLEIFFHDDTVEPGKTYRYQIVVYVKNPLFDTRGVAEKQADSDIFALKIVSPWTGPVAVPSKYFFFLANAPSRLMGKTNVKVDYFYWTDGNWQTKQLPLQPGDPIGDTDWTMVDVRDDARAQHDRDRVLFSNSQGLIAARSYALDKNDPEWKRLKDQAGKPAAATGTAAPAGDNLFTR